MEMQCRSNCVPRICNYNEDEFRIVLQAEYGSILFEYRIISGNFYVGNLLLQPGSKFFFS